MEPIPLEGALRRWAKPEIIDQARRGGGVGDRRRSFPGKTSDAGQTNFAEQSSLQPSYRFPHGGRSPTLDSMETDPPGILDGLNQLPTLKDIGRTGLFEINIFPCRQGGQGNLGMGRIPGGDGDRVDLPVFQ
jgi:hypothetical protein